MAYLESPTESSTTYYYAKFYESDLEEIAMDVLSSDEFEMGDF